MSNAKQCNRCKRYFNPLQTEFTMCQFRNPVFLTKKNVAEGTVQSRLLPDEPADAWVDLCTSCSEDFELFMDNTPLAIYNDPPVCEKDASKDHTWVTEYSYLNQKPSVVMSLQNPPEAFRDVSSIDNK